MSGNLSLVNDSGTWLNGQQRRLTIDGQSDPYNKNLTINSGVKRSLFIDGRGSAFHSGHKSRIDILTNSFNVRLNIGITFNSSIDHITFRLRSRRNIVSAVSAEKFAGYLCIIYHDHVEFKKELTKGSYSNLNPASHTFATAIPNDNRRIDFAISLYQDADVDTGIPFSQNVVKLKMDYNTGKGLEFIKKSVDASPEAQTLNKFINQTKSWTSIRLFGNGSAEPIDCIYKYMRLEDLSENFVP